MNKLQHFVAKHRNPCKIIGIPVLCACWVALAVCYDLKMWIIVVGYLISAFVFIAWVNSAPGVIMQSTEKAFGEECDPYPLLLETEKLLTYKNSVSMQQLILINRGVALLDVGEFQQAYDIYKGINIDTNPVLSTRCLYYNNLFNMCMALGKYDEAGVWFEKLIQLYDGLKENKTKTLLRHSVESTKALEFYRKGQYHEAIEQINSCPPKNKRNRVNFAVDYARFCIALGENERASEALDFVIANGNRLYCVNEATEMLREIRAAED